MGSYLSYIICFYRDSLAEKAKFFGTILSTSKKNMFECLHEKFELFNDIFDVNFFFKAPL